MKHRYLLTLLLAASWAGGSFAQDRSQKPPQPDGVEQSQAVQRGQGKHQPPHQAYADCKGKKAGDSVQHTTPEGMVAATCAESPQGLVARPNQPRVNPTK